MGIEEDLSIIDAALYASDRPLTLVELGRLLNTSSETYVSKIIEDIKQRLDRRGSPLVLVQTAKDAYMLRLREEFIPRLGGLIQKVKPSRGELKTLALIAYEQPVYQAKVAKMRGGHAYEQIKRLVSMGFVESRPAGRTRILRTSKKFASYFGFEDDVEMIRQRLEELGG